ncbi:MAG: helix-turn-helix transcriptional regulator [Candidatus Nanopelagicales bacterium]
MADSPHSETRAKVLSVIECSATPVTVETITERTRLHANTVRGHLDVLLAGGSISRVAEDAHGRGRPRWLYRSAERPGSPFRALAEALTAQLTEVSDPSIARAAAERWGQALPDLPVADSPDEAVAQATDALNRLGFNASASAIGDAIAVTGCPYADLVADNPVICDIHTALVSRLLAQSGQPVTVEAMDVWTRPGMCMARLRRPDLVPARTIIVDEIGHIQPQEGTGP